MYIVLKITVISLAIFTYTVISNDNDLNINDDSREDETEEMLTEDERDAMQELFDSDTFKFLENINDDDILEGKSQFVGRATENTYCYVTDEEPYQYFSTKTHYPQVNDTSHMDPAPGCEVVYVWMVMRHGIRYGSASKTYSYYHLGQLRDEIIKNAGYKRTELCMEDIFNFLFWMPVQLPGQNPIIPNTLTENGYNLVREKAKLLKEKFPHLIPPEYNPNILKIEYTDEIKTNQSVQAITEELFGEPYLPPYDTEGLLEKVYVSKCRRPNALDRETGKNFTYLTQNADYVQEMVKQVSLKLGFEPPLKYREVANMYDGCQYEIAWGHDRSPWCAGFTKEHLKIMEYIGDISYFYLCGPGDIYNYFQGCVILKDLIENLMESAEDENRELKMKLIVGHSTTVLLLITQLGLTNDPMLTHNNFFELADRKWRTSLLAPYTGNIMAILQRCSTGEKYRVKFLLNDKPFLFKDICDENYLCSLDKLYKLFEAIIKSKECSSRYCSHSAEEMCTYLKFSDKDCEILKLQVARWEDMKAEKHQTAKDVEEEEDGDIEEFEGKVEEEEPKKEPVKPKQFLLLEKEYKKACILICICMVVIIGVFTKMNGGFRRIFRRSKDAPKKEKKKSKSEESDIKSKDDGKTKSKDKNNTKNNEVAKTKSKDKGSKHNTEKKKDS